MTPHLSGAHLRRSSETALFYVWVRQTGKKSIEEKKTASCAADGEGVVMFGYILESGTFKQFHLESFGYN